MVCVSLYTDRLVSKTAPNVSPHLIDEHDGENGHVDEFGFAAGEKEGETWRGQRGHLAQHVAQLGTQCDNSEVGESSVRFNLREAWDSFQDDIKLSSLAGTNGNTGGLNKENIKSFS